MPDQSLTFPRNSKGSSASPWWICSGSGRKCCGCTQGNGSRLVSQALCSRVPVAGAESKDHEAELIPTVQRLLVPAALSGDAKSLVFGKVFLRLAKMDKQLAWH